MANETAGLLGRKLGMTQIYNSEDMMVPVTVIEVGNNTVVRTKTADSADGYNAVQLGIGSRKASRMTKAVAGHFAKNNVEPAQVIRELRVGTAELALYSAGGTVGVADIFTEGLRVDVCGTSKGSGFSGVMKRHNFKGFIRSHGTHEFFRHGGSIGTRLTPGHVMKGKKMPGQEGNARTTVQNLKVARVDAERGLVFVAGGVPGPNGGLVFVRRAVKGQGKK